MTAAPCIWLTRPEGENETLAALLAERGVASVIAPVAQIVTLPQPPSSTACEAVLLTSRHAVPPLHCAPDTPLFCVGDATAEAARKAGFTQIITGEGNVASLLPVLKTHLSAGSRLYYPSAEHISVDVAPLLAAFGITVLREIVYRVEETVPFPPALHAAFAEKRLTGVAMLSPRHAHLIIEAMYRHAWFYHAPHLTAYCLSPRIAEVANGLPWAARRIAATSNLASLVDAIAPL